MFFTWDPQDKMVTSSGEPDVLRVGTKKKDLPSPYDVLIDKLDRAFEKETFRQDFDFCFQPQEGRWFRVHSCPSTCISHSRDEVMVILTNISESKKLTDRLKGEKNEALALSKMIIHDIKNPLMTIMNVGRLLELEGKGENFSNYTALISEVSKEAMNMADKVGELLSIMSDKEKQELTPLVLDVELEALVAQKKAQHTERHIGLEVEDEARNEEVKASRPAIRNIFEQMVNNAIKFSETHTRITISLKKEGSALILACVDEGIGVPALQASQLLNKLPTSSRKGLRGEKGYGLGLPIMKKLTENLNGTIAFESDEDQGTTVRIALPIH
ncbi:sensor histidine kinase [Roseivirga sp. BDSF3-8]|uniref:sensor histidine kinase n=1 Tax=Roseivirga sp. BDSF3-8 TaxID=3241598 RepID=UPI003531BC84